MLGCFVGPAGVAASGVPERFLDKSALGKKVSKPSSEDGPSTTGKDSTNATAGGNTPATSQTELMEVDQ